ncbi:sulfite exporter TauE/SafE family protein [bacterium]|nr:sulfite exporter TauE/SafE family protein [candidate division CSSED10-310 bacterium]
MDVAVVFANWWNIPVLFGIGLFAGVCNVLAGGGSLVTIPVLIFMGLDAGTANGTNRVAIAIQNIFAVAGFRHKGFGNWKFTFLLVFPALPGTIMGAVVASTITDALFRKILSLVMILVLVLILVKSSQHERMETITETDLTWTQKLCAMILFLGIGFYSGFIQAGVGFLVMAALTLTTGLDLIRINSHKVAVIGICTWIAVLVFILYGKIIWSAALILSAGNAAGGWMGSMASVAGGETWIKRILVVAVTAMAFKLSGLPEFVFELIR